MELLAFLAIALLVFLVTWAIRSFRSNEKVVTAVLAAGVTVATAILSTSLADYSARKAEIRNAYRLQKIEVYEGFVELVVKMFQGAKEWETEQLTPEEEDKRYLELAEKLQSDFIQFGQSLLLWGDPSVIQAYGELKTFSLYMNRIDLNEKERNMRVICLTDRVFREMRSDLDLDNFGLATGDLIAIFLTDPTEVKGIDAYCA